MHINSKTHFIHWSSATERSLPTPESKLLLALIFLQSSWSHRHLYQSMNFERNLHQLTKKHASFKHRNHCNTTLKFTDCSLCCQTIPDNTECSAQSSRHCESSNIFTEAGERMPQPLSYAGSAHTFITPSLNTFRSTSEHTHGFPLQNILQRRTQM